MTPLLQGPALWLVCTVLICASLSDLRQLRIPNGLVAGLAGIWVVLVFPTLPWAETGSRMLAAASLFALGFAAFATGRLGGGDVKLLAVLMLFVPSNGLVLFALFLSGGLILSLLAIGTCRRLSTGPRGGWNGLWHLGRTPLGPGIGGAGLAFVVFGPQASALL